MTEINELSKKTLGSYIRRAGESRTRIAGYRDHIRSAGNAVAQASFAARETDGEAKARHGYSSALSAQDDRLRGKDLKRQHGIYRATKKLTKENQDLEPETDQHDMEVEDASVIDRPVPETSVADVLAATAAGRPADAQAAFTQVLLDRVADFVATRREELAQEMFAGPRDPEEEDDEAQEDLFGDDDIPDDGEAPGEEDAPGDGEEIEEISHALIGRYVIDELTGKGKLVDIEHHHDREMLRAARQTRASRGVDREAQDARYAYHALSRERASRLHDRASALSALRQSKENSSEEREATRDARTRYHGLRRRGEQG